MNSLSNHSTVLETWLNLSGRGFYAAAIIGLVVITAVFGAQLFATTSEYVSFYVGARLAGTPYLYDRERVYQEQIHAVGGYGDPFLFGRLPFYAVFLSWLGRLPYRIAFQIWQGISFAALLGFAFLWRIPNTRLTFLACCWSLPLLMVFLYGQDVTFVLLLITLAFRFSGERPILTGLIMSLFAIKFHLFLLLPLLLLGQRRSKMAIGFSLGALGLTGISFAASGPDWPAKMADVIFSKTILPKEYLMPNFRGLLQPITDQFLPELCLDLIVAVLVFGIVRRTDFQFGMAAVIIGSLLVSHHAGPQDCALLLPVLLVVAGSATNATVNWLCLILLTPLPYTLLTFGGAASAVAKMSFVALLFAMAIQTVRASPVGPYTSRMLGSIE